MSTKKILSIIIAFIIVTLIACTQTKLMELKITGNNQILYILNLNETNREITINSELFVGSSLRNLFTDEVIQINNGQVTIQTNILEPMFFLVED